MDTGTAHHGEDWKQMLIKEQKDSELAAQHFQATRHAVTMPCDDECTASVD
jgi:hypothetical protein